MQDQRQVPQGKNISPFSLHLIQGTLSLREPGYSSALKQVPQHRNEKESITVSFRETSLPCSISSCYASSALQREYSHFPGKENGFTITVVVCTKWEQSKESSLDATWEVGKNENCFLVFFSALYSSGPALMLSAGTWTRSLIFKAWLLSLDFFKFSVTCTANSLYVIKSTQTVAEYLNEFSLREHAYQLQGLHAVSIGPIVILAGVLGVSFETIENKHWKQLLLPTSTSVLSKFVKTFLFFLLANYCAILFRFWLLTINPPCQSFWTVSQMYLNKQMHVTIAAGL